MATEQNPAIEFLVAQIDELERKANAFRASVNVLRQSDGLPPMFPDLGGGGSGGVRAPHEASRGVTQIKPDTFYKKPQQTAVRELLAMRKLSGDGPAKPNEILEALKAGGYQVEAKSDDIALVGLRAMLRKRPEVFHKLPNGTWGLRDWYQNAKPYAKPHKEGADKSPVASTDNASDLHEDEIETADTAEASAA
jgi:hypothetical protein